MSSSAVEIREPRATHVRFEEGALVVDLADGRTLAVPLSWYPRLLHATVEEQAHWRLIGNGKGIHWPDIEEDISVPALLAGQPSSERPDSLKRWLDQRMS